MLGDRVHDLQPFIGVVYFPYCLKGFVDVRHGRDERSPCFDRTAQRHPVEGISPAIMIEAGASSALEDIEKVERSLVMRFVFRIFGQQRKPHRIMSIGDGKTLSFPEYPPCGGHKGLGEHHRSDGAQTQEWFFVVQRFGSLSQIAGIESLKVVRSFPVLFQPFGELRDGCLRFLDRQRNGLFYCRDVDREHCLRAHEFLLSGVDNNLASTTSGLWSKAERTAGTRNRIVYVRAFLAAFETRNVSLRPQRADG